MNVMILGSGGREHALAWKIRQSPLLETLYCIPGNPGTSELAKNISIPLDDFDALAQFAIQQNIGLTVVGPEVPLVNGIVDFFAQRNLVVFGPTKAAARLEGSKAFSKNFLKQRNIPTANFATFENQREARTFIKNNTRYPIVLKADGLAAGKGVLICTTREAALDGVQTIMGDKSFGTAGDTLLIEQFLPGDELSLFALCDGRDYLLLSAAQDHKRIGEGDTGKNTGGMGAYAPAPLASPELIRSIKDTIIFPTLKGMADLNTPYRGLLYVGCIIVDEIPYVLEFNCRFGDPETQVVLPLVESDLLPILQACANGNLAGKTIRFHDLCAFDVVLASGGYPEAYPKGKVISGIDDTDDKTIIFHAGTKIENGKLVTAGGRVLNVVSCDANFETCAKQAYTAIDKIHFDGMYCRRDIGKQVLK